MAIARLIYFCLGAGSIAFKQEESCGADGVCETQGGSSLIQRIAVEGKFASLSDRLQTRRESVVGSLECIDHIFTVLAFEAGWADSELVMKSAVGEHMASILTEKEPGDLDLDQATEYLWKSHKEFYCAVSGNDECKIDGHSFDDIRAAARSDSAQPREAKLAQLSMDKATHGHAAVAGSRCHSTHAENVRDVERGHGLRRASLDALAGGLNTLQERGVTQSYILRTLSARVVEDTAASTASAASDRGRSLLEVEPVGHSVAKTLAHVLLANHFLLLALGEPSALAKEESMEAATDILLEEGRCKEMAPDGHKGIGIVQAVSMLIKPYMQLHCAVNEQCHDTYTSVITGAPDVGGSLLQMIAGAGKAGLRLVVKGMIAATMHLLGVQHFDSEVFDARAITDDVAATAHAEHTKEHAEHIAAAASLAKALLQREEVKRPGHLIWIMADLMRCHA